MEITRLIDIAHQRGMLCREELLLTGRHCDLCTDAVERRFQIACSGLYFYSLRTLKILAKVIGLYYATKVYTKILPYRLFWFSTSFILIACCSCSNQVS